MISCLSKEDGVERYIGTDSELGVGIVVGGTKVPSELSAGGLGSLDGAESSLKAY
jgi:hypothetical protein